MVLQWRNERVGEEYALEGGDGDSKLMDDMTTATSMLMLS